MRLAVKPYQGLEVVIPRKFPRKKIPFILQQHEAWIIDQLAKHQHSLQPVELPQKIILSLLDTCFLVEYSSSDTGRLIETGNTLKIQYRDDLQAIELLRNWIRSRAKQILPPMLSQIAGEFAFEYIKTTIRSQKSRWGSCSSSGTISLNDQLLFMPPETVRYLMIHELCHTRFMNHSADFWSLVDSCCDNYQQHDRNLSKGREKVPDWFTASLFKKPE